jgi:hypothetical protein
VGELHALRHRGGSACVVDRRGRVLIGVDPRSRLDAEAHQRGVGLGPERQSPWRPHARERLHELGIDEQQRRLAVADDVVDLVAPEPEVDRDDDAPRCRRAVQEVEHPGGVLADDGDPLSGRDAHRVEARGHRSRTSLQLGERELADAARRLVGFVDDGDPVGVDRRAAGEEVLRGEGDEHGFGLLRRVVRPTTRG